ncbi:MAG: 50S ribosomal protein L22 [Anaerolineales bacterium]|nr:MAG: 50S ribosomal protein L22 [Anaerolineales bacterium]
MAGFQVHAESKYIPGSPIKARRVVNVVRGMYAKEALEVLRLMPQAAAGPVAKTIQSAVANAEENFGLSKEDLVIVQIAANSGPARPWRRFGARGRFKPIRKRTSHIKVVLEEVVEEQA